jgi:hypothetical protein
LFQVVSIQRSERWTCEMRNSSMWPFKDRRCRSQAARRHECRILLRPERAEQGWRFSGRP